MKIIKLNLGCGTKYLKGYINCDISKNIKTDKLVDLEKIPYPFKDNYADEIFMDNVLEHLSDIVAVMEEVYRILKPGGTFRIIVPYGKSDWAMQDPTHKHFFTERSMDYFCEGFDYNFYSNIRFKKHAGRLFNGTETLTGKLRSYIPFKRLLRYYFFNIYDGIYFELEAIK